MKKLLQLVKLNRGGKKLFLQTYILMSAIRFSLFFLPFRQLQYLILKAHRLKFFAVVAPKTSIGAIALAVHRSAKYSPGEVKCLAKALTTAVLMNIYGFPYKLKIGVAKDENNRLEAHAWIEWKGKIVVGYLPDLSRYRAMSSVGQGLII